MRASLGRAYREIRELHARLTVDLTALERSLKDETDEKEHADTAYALREIAEFADAIRKQSEFVKVLSERMACMLTIAIHQTAEPIRTEFCTASPKVRTVVTVPSRRKSPEQFASLMTFLGVPRHLWEGGEHAVVETHWPGLIEYLGKLQAEGKPLPPGIDPNKTIAQYSLMIRGKKSPNGELGRAAPMGAGEEADADAKQQVGEEIPF